MTMASDGAAPDAPTDLLAPYDAVLLLSFGGPEDPAEVMPFLRRVTAGKGIPDARLALVAEHYLARGGVSPINGENRILLDLLRAELARRGTGVPVHWGNRNSAPFLVDALREAHGGGARRILTVLTSAYSSYSSCRQYREDLAGRRRRARRRGPRPPPRQDPPVCRPSGVRRGDHPARHRGAAGGA